ncbi:MAG: hypothetical protein ACYC7L_16195 [Nitrospirota bacterium]
MANVVKVALIGAGRSGTPLLKQLMKYKFIKIVGVADRKEKAAGIRMAAEKKIFTTTDAMELMKKGKTIDILIDVTGDMNLKKKIKDHLLKSKNTRTIIMHDLIARLFISMSAKKTALVPSFHPRDVGVGK